MISQVIYGFSVIKNSQAKKKKTIGKSQVREKISMIQLSNQLHWIEIIWVNIFDIGANDMLKVRGVFNIRTSSICVITR